MRRVFESEPRRGTGPIRSCGCRAWARLRAEVRIRVPAGIEEDEDGADVMSVADLQKCTDAVTKALGVLLPEQVVQEDAHGVHADGLGPA